MDEVPVIRRRQAAVYELIKKGIRPQAIAQQHGEPRIYQILRVLEQKQFVNRSKRGNYEALVSEYHVIEDACNSGIARSVPKPKYPVEPYEHITLNGYEKAFLLSHGHMNRSQLAKRLRKPRYVICREMISLGMDKIN